MNDHPPVPKPHLSLKAEPALGQMYPNDYRCAIIE